MEMLGLINVLQLNHGGIRGLNEDIVQNHIKIAFLDIFFYPLKIFHLFGFPSWESSDPKIIGIKT